MNATEENPQQINAVDPAASSDRNGLGVNVPGTDSKSGTSLTQPCSQAVPNPLLVARGVYGYDTPSGHGCSNLNEQMLARPSYVRPTWATHPTQTLGAMMAWQADRLAALSSPSPKGN